MTIAKKKCVVCRQEFEPAPQNRERQKVCTPLSHKCEVEYAKLQSGRHQRIGCKERCCRDNYVHRVPNPEVSDAKLIDKESLDTILATAKILDEDFYLFIRLTYSLALRIGEAPLLTPSHFKKEKTDYVVMVVALKQEGRPEYPELITAQLYKLVHEYISRHRIGKNEALFSKTTRWYRKLWERTQVRAGIKDPWNFHCLRHTALSGAARESGEDIAVVQRLGRHRSLTSTQLYVHADRERLRALLKKRRYA